MRLFVSALLALNIALAYSAPSNQVSVESSADSDAVSILLLFTQIRTVAESWPDIIL